MKKNPFVPALILGAATFALSALFPAIPKAPGVMSPIIELEFARSTEEVHRITGFDAPGEAAADEKIVDAIRANTAHDRWFIFTYTLFLAVSCLIMYKLSGSPVLIGGALLALAAGTFDFGENRQMLLLLDQLNGDPGPALQNLQLFTWLKWGSIVMAFGAMAPFAWSRSLPGKLLAGFTVAAVVAGIVAAGLKAPLYYIAFSVLVMVLFLLLFLFEITWRHAPQTPHT